MTTVEIQTERRLATMEQKIADVCVNVDEMKQVNSTEHQEIKKMINDFIESADKKYAPSWIATAVKTFLGLLATATIGFIVWIIERIIDGHLKF